MAPSPTLVARHTGKHAYLNVYLPLVSEAASLMDTLEELYVPDRESWRKWLEANHGGKKGVWLVFYKTHAGRPSLPYDSAVEEALCYGWIDSIIKKLDEDRYARKFTPRKPHSVWSKSNIERIERMVKEGRMSEAGLSIVEQSKKNGEFVEAETPPEEIEPPQSMIEAMAANGVALENFNRLARSHKRQYVAWLLNAKKDETRRKRLAEIVELLERNEKLGLR